MKIDSKPDVRVRCALNPAEIQDNVREAVREIAAVISGEWRRMVDLAALAGAELPGPEYHEASARAAVLTKALKRIGFAVEPPDDWHCGVKGCTEAVGHGGRCTWMGGERKLTIIEGGRA